ncbi:MAG: hypothetical protein LC781_04700 [Actinobacteria bacterium]|nr:hypothetical protein [Actinomycetota bacterium]
MTSYEQLADFVDNRMRMSHVYQPVMLMTLLREGGKRSTEELAKAILAHDESQVEFYENVTKNMVGASSGGTGSSRRRTTVITLSATMTSTTSRSST